MEYIGKGIGTMALCAMVLGIAFVLPSAIVGAFVVCGIVAFVMWNV